MDCDKHRSQVLFAHLLPSKNEIIHTIEKLACAIVTSELQKIDIEESELQLFSRNTESWLPRIRNLCIELHGPECEAIVFRALADYSYDLSRTGELTVCSNLRIRP
jgi:hypothetical protein